MRLRQESQLPLGTCRSALQATNWNFEEAVIHLEKEAKALGMKKMESLASRKTPEGCVGVATEGNKGAMVIINCESEPVSKTPEFNKLVNTVTSTLLAKEAGEFTGEAIVELDGVKDSLAQAIGLLKENIQIKSGKVVAAPNLGYYVRNFNKEYPNNGTYGSLVSLSGGSAELSADLAAHCVLELPDVTGDIPEGPLSIDNLAADENRLLYQPLNGGQSIVFNVLAEQNAELLSWTRFKVSKMVWDILVAGSLNVDQIAYCSRLPGPGETLLGERYETGLGGKGANQAVQAALLSGEGKVGLLGAVGDDQNGSWYVEELAKTGTDCSKIITKADCSTGVAPITVSMENGENSIVVVPGANMRFTGEDLDEEAFKGTKIVICQNEIPVSTTKRALQLGRAAGAKTIYSPAPCPSREDFETFSEEIDYLIANQTEALELSGKETIQEAATTLQEKYKIKSVIVTLGGDGFAVKSEGELTLHPVVEKVDVVDTTGAGDSFVGAFSYSLTKTQKTTIEHAKFASMVASRSTTRKGTQKSYFPLSELE
ncbi:Oidioi.mRNA.OKI2018_I69.chr2.g8082.t1.cds [Oikopleura dioica]|uniref:Multifunctional fusion protein n=1 Tax=Oikopleura dioica TaxID=34765 RepID=A0ABN7TCN9_OIKDI|nr:Oidioi.mRNA.OKI2018_I69.chr2.g8082.t1.cds [Oikopleura dioica]